LDNFDDCREVSGFGGLYLINSTGTRVVSFRGRDARDLSIQTGSTGYRFVGLAKCGKSVTRYIHRLVAEAFIGPIPDGMDVCHKDGDKANNCFENLYIGTKSQNMRDAIRHGTFRMGSDHPKTRLTWREVNAIRWLAFSTPVTNKMLATAFGISTSTADRIIRGETHNPPSDWLEAKGIQTEEWLING
jgi:hypothetical protein